LGHGLPKNGVSKTRYYFTVGALRAPRTVFESTELPLNTRLLSRIDELSPQAWNALSVEPYPFLRHEFLQALEAHDCLGRYVGWFPRHLVCEEDTGRLIGALPMYLTANSFGEFVFDWSWAHAHERCGLKYYPKAVIASPFTPANGPRLLIAAEADRETAATALIDAALTAARKLGLSSAHWLFGTDPELAAHPELLARKGCQFHWENPGYRDFEDFLDTLTAKRRKEIRRERRQAAEAGLSIERLPGDRASDADWRQFHQLYQITFDKHGNHAALTCAFFAGLGQAMGAQVLLTVARKGGEIVAAAFFLVGSEALSGRYWGAEEDVPALHFELCYYQGIEYCIEHGLRRFEPGAQGEHKVSRGFMPRPTWSYHWIADPELRLGIQRFVQREAQEVDAYMAALGGRSVYRREA
jgi:predicted N-acyltransferase